MMTILWVVSVFCLLWVLGTRLLWANKAHDQVVGLVTAVNHRRLLLQTMEGKTVEVVLSRNTRFLLTCVATGRGAVRVGDRVVVEVTEAADGIWAVRVRSATGAAAGTLSRWQAGLELCLAVLAQGVMTESPEQASRPIEEMRGGCAQYALDIRSELTAMKGLLQAVTSLAERGTASPITPDWQGLSVTLHHSGVVSLTTIPKREGVNAGLIPVTIPEEGRYRISAGSAVWIEVVQGRTRVEPIGFEMQTGVPRSSRRSSIS